MNNIDYPDGKYVVKIYDNGWNVIEKTWASKNPVLLPVQLAPLQPNFIQIPNGKYGFNIYPIQSIRFAKIAFIEEGCKEEDEDEDD